MPGGGAGHPRAFLLAGVGGIQEALTALGYDPGPIDGIDGPRTRAAVSAFQRDQGLAEDGQWGEHTHAAMVAALRAKGFPVDGD